MMNCWYKIFVTNEELVNKGYLTSIPSEYVTETELNEALSNLQPSGGNTSLKMS